MVHDISSRHLLALLGPEHADPCTYAREERFYVVSSHTLAWELQISCQSAGTKHSRTCLAGWFRWIGNGLGLDWVWRPTLETRKIQLDLWGARTTPRPRNLSSATPSHVRTGSDIPP